MGRHVLQSQASSRLNKDFEHFASQQYDKSLKAKFEQMMKAEVEYNKRALQVDYDICSDIFL